MGTIKILHGYRVIMVMSGALIFLFLMAPHARTQPPPTPPTADQIDQATKELDRPIAEEMDKKMLNPPRKPSGLKDELDEEFEEESTGGASKHKPKYELEYDPSTHMLGYEPDDKQK